MHFVFAARGILHGMEMYQKFLETQMFPFSQLPILKDEKGNFLKNEDGTYKHADKPLDGIKVQGALRPIQLYEYIFPEECLPQVLAMMGLNKDYDNMRPEMTPISWTLRKMLHLQKIPDMPDVKKKEAWEITQDIIPYLGVAVYPIGIKKDSKQDFIFGDKGYFQEGL
jgi:hypothetical protein